MVGGSSASRARAPSKGVDFEEALGDDVPMELWTRQLRGSFHRSVLAFPPKPRSGCTWTALGAGRLLLLGGRSQGRCLADVHILQLQGPKMPSKTDRSPKSEDRGEDSDSEAEAIFFASYRAACGSGKPPKAQKSPQEMVKRRGSDSETDSEEEPERSKMSNLSRAMPCSTQEVLAMASQVKKTPSPSGKSRRACQPKVAERVEVMTSRKRAGDNRRRWKNTHRRGHVQGTARCCRCLCFAARPLRCWCTAAWETVGLPLGDTYELRILETEDQSLEFVWSLLDAGGKEHCETAPWEHQSAPRPRACHSAVFWSGSQRSMVVFGGLGMGLEGEPKEGDCWLYLVSQRSAQAVGGWKRPTLTGGAPARRWGHGACMVGDAMLICGGMDATGQLGDCWLLQLQSMRWEQLETSIPKELGRCQALWSSSEQAAVIWSCHGSWCFVPGKEPEKEKSTNASPWSSKFPKLDDLRLPLADAMAPAPAVGTPKASLPPVRAGPWKACRGEAEAFHQSWPQQVTPRKEKRSVNSAVGRERPRKASREVQGRELGPVKPPRARPPMKC